MPRGSNPGERRGGRQKGTPNVRTAKERELLRDAILGAFEDAGGRAYLRKVALAEPSVFCSLLGKVLPTQLEGTGEGGAIIVKWQAPS